MTGPLEINVRDRFPRRQSLRFEYLRNEIDTLLLLLRVKRDTKFHAVPPRSIRGRCTTYALIHAFPIRRFVGYCIHSRVQSDRIPFGIFKLTIFNSYIVVYKIKIFFEN